MFEDRHLTCQSLEIGVLEPLNGCLFNLALQLHFFATLSGLCYFLFYLTECDN